MNFESGTTRTEPLSVERALEKFDEQSFLAALREFPQNLRQAVAGTDSRQVAQGRACDMLLDVLQSHAVFNVEIQDGNVLQAAVPVVDSYGSVGFLRPEAVVELLREHRFGEVPLSQSAIDLGNLERPLEAIARSIRAL